MSDPEDWKKETVTAVASATSLVASFSATELPDVAKASLGVTYVIINNFNFSHNPEAVSDKYYRELEAKVRNLEAQIEAAQGPNTEAFKCKEEFERHWQTARTKRQKFNCIAAYIACLGHGFKNPISIY